LISSYGGIYERGAKEYTLDDFYSLQLDKLDKVVCLKESGIVPEEGENDESEEDDEDDDEDDDSESEGDAEDDSMEHVQDEQKVESVEAGETRELVVIEEAKVSLHQHMIGFNVLTKVLQSANAIRLKAQALLQQANVAQPIENADPSSDAHITPLPGETLSTFYARTKEHWASKARHEGGSDNRGKSLRRDGFAMAQERWEEYKPVLEEVEKIMREAGLDEGGDIVMAGGMSKMAGGGMSESRNRR